MGQNYLPPAFIALSIQNGMGYRYLNVRVNSTDDASISCKNIVNFGPVTPEKTGRIFAIFSPYESALLADDESVPYFPICQGTLP